MAHCESFVTFLEKLIRDGKAYVDNTPVEVMKQERETKTASKCHNNCKYMNAHTTCIMCIVHLPTVATL